VEELKEILSPLLPFVRTEHILPPNSDVLADAVSTAGLPFLVCVCVCVCVRAHAYVHLSHGDLHRPNIDPHSSPLFTA